MFRTEIHWEELIKLVMSPLLSCSGWSRGLQQHLQRGWVQFLIQHDPTKISCRKDEVWPRLGLQTPLPMIWPTTMNLLQVAFHSVELMMDPFGSAPSLGIGTVVLHPVCGKIAGCKQDYTNTFKPLFGTLSCTASLSTYVLWCFVIVHHALILSTTVRLAGTKTMPYCTIRGLPLRSQYYLPCNDGFPKTAKDRNEAAW